MTPPNGAKRLEYAGLLKRMFAPFDAIIKRGRWSNFHGHGTYPNPATAPPRVKALAARVKRAQTLHLKLASELAEAGWIVTNGAMQATYAIQRKIDEQARADMKERYEILMALDRVARLDLIDMPPEKAGPYLRALQKKLDKLK